jgi:hypothetical protein
MLANLFVNNPRESVPIKNFISDKQLQQIRHSGVICLICEQQTFFNKINAHTLYNNKILKIILS